MFNTPNGEQLLPLLLESFCGSIIQVTFQLKLRLREFKTSQSIAAAKSKPMMRQSAPNAMSLAAPLNAATAMIRPIAVEILAMQSVFNLVAEATSALVKAQMLPPSPARKTVRPAEKSLRDHSTFDCCCFCFCAPRPMRTSPRIAEAILNPPEKDASTASMPAMLLTLTVCTVSPPWAKTTPASAALQPSAIRKGKVVLGESLIRQFFHYGPLH